MGKVKLYGHCEHCREKETNRVWIIHQDPCGERGCKDGKKVIDMKEVE